MNTGIIGAFVGIIGAIVVAVINGMFQKKKDISVSPNLKAFTMLKSCPNMDSVEDKDLIDAFRDDINRERYALNRKADVWILILLIIALIAIIAWLPERFHEVSQEADLFFAYVVMGFSSIMLIIATILIMFRLVQILSLRGYKSTKPISNDENNPKKSSTVERQKPTKRKPKR